jgi:hypothetical protein
VSARLHEQIGRAKTRRRNGGTDGDVAQFSAKLDVENTSRLSPDFYSGCIVLGTGNSGPEPISFRTAFKMSVSFSRSSFNPRA